MSVQLKYKTMRAPSNSHKDYVATLSACLGALFDGFDASIFGIVLYPAISDLIQSDSHAAVGAIGSMVLALFMIGWALGAIVFGALSDRIGRVRTMSFTILLYAISAGLCATSHTWQELACYRFFVGFGIGGEQGAGVIFLSERFRGKNRYWNIGLMKVALTTGYLLSTGVNFLLGHAGWRYVCLTGILPALLAFYVRVKLSEPKSAISWRYTRLKRISRSPLLAVRSIFSAHARKTVVILALASTAIVNWWAVLTWVPAWVNQLTGGLAVEERSATMFAMYSGAIAASLVGIPLLLRLGRKQAFRFAFLGALLTDIAMFASVKAYGAPLILFAFIAGAFASLAFLCLFVSVPEMYPKNIRGTAFGISLQTGRIFAAIAVIFGGQIISAFHGSYAIAASSVALVNLIGFLGSFFIPEDENYLLAAEAIEDSTPQKNFLADVPI
jgi:MFS family permease